MKNDSSSTLWFGEIVMESYWFEKVWRRPLSWLLTLATNCILFGLILFNMNYYYYYLSFQFFYRLYMQWCFWWNGHGDPSEVVMETLDHFIKAWVVPVLFTLLLLLLLLPLPLLLCNLFFMFVVCVVDRAWSTTGRCTIALYYAICGEDFGG